MKFHERKVEVQGDDHGCSMAELLDEFISCGKCNVHTGPQACSGASSQELSCLLGKARNPSIANSK